MIGYSHRKKRGYAMCIDPQKRDALYALGNFTEWDFSDKGLSEDEKEFYFTHLGVEMESIFLLKCDASKPENGPYSVRVTADFSSTVNCNCKAGQNNRYCKHRSRCQLILHRRQQRIAKEQASKEEKKVDYIEERMMRASLNGRRGFSLIS